MLFAHLKRILKLDQLRCEVPAAPETSSSSPLHPEPPQDGQVDPDADAYGTRLKRRARPTVF
jgi:hypothetical protein